jgi:GAF domain-containing protein
MDKAILFKRIIEEVGTNFNLDSVLHVICKELLILFRVDRVAMARYGTESGRWTVLYEYRSNNRIPSISNAEYSPEYVNYVNEQFHDKNQDLIIDNLQTSDQPEFYKKEHRKLGTKSLLVIPIQKGAEKWGILGLMQNQSYRHWSKDDVNLLHTIVDYIYLAIRQAELFSTITHQAERESALRDAISAVRSSLDVNEIKSTFVNIIGKYFEADRVVYSEFDLQRNIFLPANQYSEYLINHEIFSFVGYEWNVKKVLPYIKLLKESKEINFSNLKQYLKDNNLENSDIEKIFSEWGIKSSYNILITFGDNIMGFFCIDYLQNEHKINKEDMVFLRTFANQMGIALYQSKLFESVKQISERELTLRKTIELLRSTLDSEQIKISFVEIIGKYFDADRCLFNDYNWELNILSPFRIERLKSPDIESLKYFDVAANYPEFVAKINKGRNIIVKDVEKTYSRKRFTGYKSLETQHSKGIKSDYGFSVDYEGIHFGSIIIHFTTTKRILNHDELDFLNVLRNQVAIALYQSELYKKEKETAERERILRDISNKIRSSFNIEFIKHEIVNQIGLLFNADRVAIADYSFESENYSVTKDAEYKPKENYKSFIGVDYKSIPGFNDYVKQKHLKDIDIIFNNLEAYLDENNLRGTGIEKFYREFGFISSAAINIYYRDNFLGNLVITFEHTRFFSVEEIKFLRSLADQVGVAIYQAELFETIQQTAENERVLRQIVISSVSSFNLEDIINSIVTETGKYFKADRCFFVEYDPELDTHKTIKKYAEYRSSEQIKSFSGRKFIKSELDIFEKDIKKKQIITVDHIEDINLPEEANQMIQCELSVKSYLIAPVFYGNTLYGALVLHYVYDYKHFTQNDINVAEAVANQSAIVLHQADLFNKVEELSTKEKLLREIISSIKLSNDLEQVYNYILSKLSKVFNVDRTIFVSGSETEPKEPVIKYEFNEHPEIKTLINIELPTVCIMSLLKILENKSSLVINDAKLYYPDNAEVQNFFNDHNVKSILASPLVKYNKEQNIIGAIVLCTNNQREWTKKEIELLEEILNASVLIIWEIIKRNELEQLRNTFILTLAHDLEVPLVGERRALEFIMAIPPGQLLDKYKDLIAETIKSNQNISNFLKKLVDSYAYDLGRKKLYLVKTDINRLIEDLINTQIPLAKLKEIIINKELQENIPFIKIDVDEIRKTINTLIENAVTYSPVNSQVRITSLLIKNNITICVIDNGAGMSKEIQNRLFKRYETALAIERKIGAGLGLYLAKQVVEAHGGKIWFKSEENKGTTFCITLPVK